MILFMAALSNIPRDLLEVADMEGASPWFKFVQVKLRFLSPTILLSLSFPDQFIQSFQGGLFAHRRLSLWRAIYATTFHEQHLPVLDYQKLASAAIVMAIAMVIIIGVLFIIENKFGKDVEG